MENLSKEQLLILLQAGKPQVEAATPPSKKPRKKIEQEEAKKETKKDTDTVACFEKKYASNFERMNELLATLNENTIEVAKLKREKKAEREAEKLKLKETPTAPIIASVVPPPSTQTAAPIIGGGVPPAAPYVPNPAYAPPPLAPIRKLPSRDMFRQNRLPQY